MHVRTILVTLSTALAALAASAASPAFAHVSVSGPGLAGQRQVLTFGIGHGCAGADTVSLTVQIPEEVAAELRVLPTPFGAVEMELDATEAVTSVTWTKTDASDRDDHYYQLAIRVAIPDAPFTTLLFPATQVCRAMDGTETTVEWAATPEEVAAAPMDMEPEPAPTLTILPARSPGWNKYDAPAAITDLSIFDDAEIVWVGDAAYSSNAAYQALIETEDGVTALTEIEAGAEIWVKY